MKQELSLLEQPDATSEENLVRVRRLRDGTLIDLSTGKPYESPHKTDWARFDALTDEEVEAAALSDPDNPPLTEEELAQMRRVVSAREVRKKLKMTQVAFAETFEIPLGTLRDWEQKGFFISHNRAAASYLRVIEQNPDAVIQALNAYRPPIEEPVENKHESLVS
jgi:putative transcriptional regulator